MRATARRYSSDARPQQKRGRQRLLLAVMALVLAACTRQSNDPASEPVAKVNGQALSRGVFEGFVAQKTGTTADKIDPKLKASLLHELQRLKAAAIAEEARADSQVAAEVELQRLAVLSQAGARKAGVYAAPSDAELHLAYDRYLAELPTNEFHVAHILVATEAQAQQLIGKLQSNSDFAKLAREQSADDSRNKGGDLGWIAPGKLPIEFFAAIKPLRPGQFAASPVHTKYGWHVIKLIESRAATAPPFEQVKAQLAVNLQQERYQKFLESSLQAAKIE